MAACLAGGCHQGAYTELYVQQLNNEARQLEDRVYEYDAAYRRLETELEVLQHDNARLRTELSIAERTTPAAGPRSLLNRPGGREPIEGRRGAPRSEDEAMPLPRRADPRSAPGVDPLDGNEGDQPTPGAVIPDPFGSRRSVDPVPSIESELVPPEIEFAEPPGALIRPTLPPLSAVDTAAEIDDPSVVRPAGVLISDVAADEELVSVRPAVAAVAALPRDVDDVDQFRIVVSEGDTPIAAADGETNTAADESISVDEAGDRFVVSLTLHPAFTRSFDADGDGVEEGMKVLVQPKTDSGEIVAVEGELTVVAVDPVKSASRPLDNPKRLGRWTFGAAELAQFYDPIGSSAGYHLQFSPLEAMPVGGQISVFVRLEMPDGRKLVNRVTLPVRTEPGASPVWTPRVSGQ